MNDPRGSLAGTLSANGLLRVAGSASGTLVGLYLVLLQASRTGSAGAGTAGTLGAVAYAAELLFSIPLGVLADAWQPRWVMVAGALLGAVAVQLFGLTHNSAIFYLSRVLEGISIAAVTPPLLAWLADRTQGDLRARARAMSFFELSLLAGLALGGVAATQLWSHFHGTAFSLIAVGYCLQRCCWLSLQVTPKRHRSATHWMACDLRCRMTTCAVWHPCGSASTR